LWLYYYSRLPSLRLKIRYMLVIVRVLDWVWIIGFRYTHSVNRTLGFFGALGFNLVSPGVNAGFITRLTPGNKICPYLLGMYGYNGVIKVQGASKYDKTYFGPSLGFGFEFHGFVKTRNFFNCELLMPIRSSSFYDDIDSMKDEGVEFKNGPMAIAFSLGYHFGE
jgi:hypothetical protein